MKYLKILCNVHIAMFYSSAISFFTLAIMLRNAKFVIFGIMAGICGIILYKRNAEKEEANKKEK